MSSPFQFFLAHFGVIFCKTEHFLAKTRKKERLLSMFLYPLRKLYKADKSSSAAQIPQITRTVNVES